MGTSGSFKVHVVVSRGQFISLVACLFLAVMVDVLGSETVALTMYYPAPYGSFMSAKITDNVTVGTAANGVLLAASGIQKTGGALTFSTASGEIFLAPQTAPLDVGSNGFANLCRLTDTGTTTCNSNEVRMCYDTVTPSGCSYQPTYIRVWCCKFTAY